LIGLFIIVFAEKNVGIRFAKRQREAVSLAVVIDIAATIASHQAFDARVGCGSLSFSAYVAWTLGVIGVLLAIINLYLAIKNNQLGPIIAASLFTIFCIGVAIIAWFLSIFCLVF